MLCMNVSKDFEGGLIMNVFKGNTLYRIADPIENLSRIVYNIRDKRRRKWWQMDIPNKYESELIVQPMAQFCEFRFVDVTDPETVRRNLNRLTQAGILRRILKGVYEKPKYSKLLEEYVAADPDAVAKALARSYHWTIAPCGNTALNLLGLSTQVTAVWSYISDGPYKTYEWNSTKLEFKHRTNKEITGLSYMTSLVIQALKTLGKSNVTPDIIQTLSEKLSDDESRPA